VEDSQAAYPKLDKKSLNILYLCLLNKQVEWG